MHINVAPFKVNNAVNIQINIAPSIPPPVSGHHILSFTLSLILCITLSTVDLNIVTPSFIILNLSGFILSTFA